MHGPHMVSASRTSRLAQALSKDEILSMVRFGAEAVFHAGAGSDPTEADIDALLARGEERTAADNSKFKTQTSSLANFSLGGEEKSLYEFEGKDMKGVKDGGAGWSLSLPKRVTKNNYDENDYYRKAMSNDKGAPKPPTAATSASPTSTPYHPPVADTSASSMPRGRRAQAAEAAAVSGLSVL